MVTDQSLRRLNMLYFAIKAALSGLLAALVSETAKRSPAFGALVASLRSVLIASRQKYEILSFACAE